MQFQSVLFDGSAEVSRAHPHDASGYSRDLNLDQIVQAITAGKDDYDLKGFFLRPTTTVAEVYYRQEIMRDLEDEAVFTGITTFAAQMRREREMVARSEKLYYKLQKQRWLLHAIVAYCDAIRKLRQNLRDVAIRSRGLLGFRDYLDAYAQSRHFSSISDSANALTKSLEELRYSVTIKDAGLKVRRYDEEKDYSEEVLQTFAKFREKAAKDNLREFQEPVELNHIEAQVLEFVAQLFPEPFAELETFTEKNADFADNVVTTFDREIQFYVSYLDFITRLKGNGLPFCYPAVSDADKNVFGREVFDLALAAKLVPENRPVVTNDFRLAEDERIFLVSGPNQGGKTTFARTFGQLHHFASLGCPVPGTSAGLFLFDAIFTHFEREENIRDLRGKLEDDLVRVHQILQEATPRSIVIMNEIFTSTTLRDALFLGRKVIEAVDRLDLLCVFVTFLHDLMTSSAKIASMVTTVLPDDPTERTFKLEPRAPDGKSYAMSISEKYRLDARTLAERLETRALTPKPVRGGRKPARQPERAVG